MRRKHSRGITFEDLWIVVAQRQRPDTHDLGNQDSTEDLGVVQQGQRSESNLAVPQSIGHHVIQAQHGLVEVLGLLELVKHLGVVAPDLLGPEHPAN